ncbi:MAG: histidine kinase, partial [Planctomycetes bacterium]|nr:histidine kinase [Planctomycetota bacterium]
ASNEELTEKTMAPEVQKEEIEHSREDLEIKSQDLALASKYKSEFLANMSHELRTPLNSFLLLSKSLQDNKKGNLDDEQVDDLRIIYEGGTDLLHLINDIMDLSKVEAGKLAVVLETVELESSCTNMSELFKPSANDKGLQFQCTCDGSAPTAIETDSQRLEQILKNFLSNAFKFTAKGSVSLQVHLPDVHTRFLSSDLTVHTAVALSVSDTGIGVPENKQREFFEAFQQEDGSTSRQYGGTGLGLTISRELAKLLGGEIHLHSVQGEGSTFTVYLPLKHSGASAQIAPMQASAQPRPISGPATGTAVQAPQMSSGASTGSTSSAPVVAEQFLPDDRNQLASADDLILIIEDDRNFASVLLKIVRNSGCR